MLGVIEMMRGWDASGLRTALLCGASALYMNSGAVAQERITTYNIPGGPLGDVLTQIGAASSSPISFSPQVVQNLRSGSIVGQMSVSQAVARAIAGSRLRALTGASGMVTVVQAAAAASNAADGVATDIADIDVSGNGINANGSSDPLATEGSKSYVATLSNAASKTPLSIKETPQSVSVLTDQQIKDRNTTTLDQAVAALPGLNVQASTSDSPLASSSLNTTYSSRGFTVNNISVDGGTPMQVGSTNTGFGSNYRPIFDLSQYDSVAVVRGSGGTYSGVGDPGGVLALQRKRPQGQTAGSIEQSFGSYGSFRTVGDITTGPLLDGLLNIRSTFVHDETNYMYKPAFKNVDQFYINAEITPSDLTKINIGATLNFTEANPWYGGLPTLSNGRFAPYPRSTALTAPWARTNIAGQEYFLQIKQKLSDNWTFNFNGTINKQNGSSNFAYYNLYDNKWINSDGTGAVVNAYRNQYAVDAYATDAFVNGHEVVFGMPVDLTFGQSYKFYQQAGTSPAQTYTYPNSMGINTFQQQNIPEVPLGGYYTAPIPYPTNNMEQMGGYMSMRISPLPWAHLLVSERISTYRQNIATSGGTVSNASVLNVPFPDMGLTLDLDQHMSIYGSFATIFQPQSVFLTPTTPAPPISGTTWEAGIKRTDFDGQLLSSIAFYTTEQVNITTADPNNPPDPNGIGLPCCYLIDGSKSQAQGIDFEMTGRIMPNWDLSLSYNYNFNNYRPGPVAQEQGNVAQTLMYSFPRHFAKLFTTVRLHTGLPDLDTYLDRVSLGFGAEYRSRAENKGVTYNFDYVAGVGWQFQQIPYTIRQGDYVIFNAMVKYDINEKTTAQLNLSNLLDRKYYQTIGGTGGGNWYGPGFSAIGTLRVAF